MKKKLPKFRSREEEAAFWSTHSVADYWKHMEPSDLTFSKNLSSQRTPATDQTINRALQLAGAWSDLDADEVERGMKRLHDERTPSAPLEDQDL